MASPVLTYPCPNCHQQVRVKPPQKSGIYKITCPHCQYKANLKLPGADSISLPGGAPAPQAPQQPAMPPQMPQMPPQQAARPAMPPQMPPQQAARPAMPPQMPQMPQMPPRQPQQPQMPPQFGQQSPARPQMPQMPQMPAPGPQQQNAPHTFVVNGGASGFGPMPGQSQAKLERIGKMFNDSYPLHPGVTTIGRYDDMVPSDIAIKGDTYMSRRSVSIEMRGASYRMKVLSSTNPVLLNGQNVPVGSETFLNFGDIITLGRTQFRLEQMK